MNNVKYEVGRIPEVLEITDLYNKSGIRRPTQDTARIAKMYENSNLVITARRENELIGIARSLTDFCFACYLSDLAVVKEFQKQGIGRALIEHTKKEIGLQTALILLSAPEALEYYPKIGFEKIGNGFIIKRVN